MFRSPGAVGGRSTSLREERDRSEIECRERSGEKQREVREKGNRETCCIRGVWWRRRGGNKVGGDSRGCGLLKKRVLGEVGVKVGVRKWKLLREVEKVKVA